MTRTQTQDEALAWKRYEQTRPRTAMAINPALLSDYPGSYRMEDGSLMSVTVQENKLYLQLIGQPEVELLAEADDFFFTTIVQAQVTFQRDDKTVVTSLTLHQNGHELAVPRVDKEAFATAQAQIEARMRDKAQFLGSQEMLHKLVEQHVHGAVDFDLMAEPLAELARTQAPLMRSELDRLGALGAITFKGVDAVGFDIYQVDFAKGHTEWGLSLTPEGMVNGLYMRNAI